MKAFLLRTPLAAAVLSALLAVLAAGCAEPSEPAEEAAPPTATTDGRPAYPDSVRREVLAALDSVAGLVPESQAAVLADVLVGAVEDVERQVAEVERLLQTHPDSVGLAAEVAVLKIIAGQKDEGERELDSLVQAYPDRFEQPQ